MKKMGKPSEDIRVVRNVLTSGGKIPKIGGGESGLTRTYRAVKITPCIHRKSLEYVRVNLHITGASLATYLPTLTLPYPTSVVWTEVENNIAGLYLGKRGSVCALLLDRWFCIQG